MLNRLYDVVENEKINLMNWNWKNTKARIFEIDNEYFITMNSNLIDNSIEEKEILAEELGHYFCNALYDMEADKTIIRKCELRAMKWAYNVLVPYHILKEKIKKMDLYELAEYFDVDSEYMYNAIMFYQDKYGFII